MEKCQRKKRGSFTSLSVINITASILPDIPVPVQQNAREEDEMVNLGMYIIDLQKDEDLPHLTPEAEDMEAELETNGGKAADDVNATDEPQTDSNATDNPQHDPNGRMPGKLPIGADFPKDYIFVKEKIASML